MMILRLPEVVFTVAESVNFTVKLNCPVCVGVPEITPVFAFKIKPGGSVEPVGKLQVTGGVPPVKVN